MKDKTYTLNEAMHMAVDGQKMCNDDLLCDKQLVYMAFKNSGFYYRNVDGYAEVFNSEAEWVSIRNWRIYKEPKVTYNGFMNVANAVDSGKRLITKAEGDTITLYKHETGIIFGIEPAYNRCDTDILGYMSKLDWTEID